MAQGQQEDLSSLFANANELVWSRSYAGQVNSAHPCQLDMAYDGYNCKGYLHFKNNDETFFLTGSIEEGKIEMIKKHEGLPKAYVNGKIEGDLVYLSFEPIGSDLAAIGTFELNVNPDLNTKGARLSLFTNRTEEIYDLPQHENKSFMDHIDQHLAPWKKAIKTKTKNADEKSVTKSMIYHHIYFENETFINGKVIFDNSWSDNRKELSFNYDLKNNKNLDFDDVFQNQKQLKVVIQEMSLQQAMSQAYYKHEGYREWLLTQESYQFSLEENGVRFYTKEDPIYGCMEAFFVYEVISKFLKRSFANRLVKK